jgi:hypothetical protein
MVGAALGPWAALGFGATVAPVFPQPKPQVICAVDRKDEETGAYRRRPRECTFHERFYPFGPAYVVPMGGIRWLHWGSQTALGEGHVRTPGAGERPAAVRLSRPVEVCGHPVFTLARIRFGNRARATRSLHLDRQIRGPRCHGFGRGRP